MANQVNGNIFNNTSIEWIKMTDSNINQSLVHNNFSNSLNPFNRLTNSDESSSLNANLNLNFDDVRLQMSELNNNL